MDARIDGDLQISQNHFFGFHSPQKIWTNLVMLPQKKNVSEGQKSIFLPDHCVLVLIPMVVAQKAAGILFGRTLHHSPPPQCFRKEKSHRSSKPKYGKQPNQHQHCKLIHDSSSSSSFASTATAGRFDVVLLFTLEPAMFKFNQDFIARERAVDLCIKAMCSQTH